MEGRRGGGEEGRDGGEEEGRGGGEEGERWRENGKGAREAVVTSEIGHIRNTGTLLHVHTPCTL